MRYLLDTNILLLYLRLHSKAGEIDRLYQPLYASNTAIISTVTIGELKALAVMNGWGAQRLKKMKELIKEFLVIPVDAEDLLDMYAEIDAFSQGRLPSHPTSLSARNMGKNDLWIAATAALTGAKLITTDKDFDHLDGKFLELIRIDLA